MIDPIRSLDDASRNHVAELTKALAQYGLGIAIPHMHDEKSNMVSIPSGVVAYEDGLRISFLGKDCVPTSAVAVGWHWIDGELRAWAGCCSNQ